MNKSSPLICEAGEWFSRRSSCVKFSCRRLLRRPHLQSHYPLHPTDMIRTEERNYVDILTTLQSITVLQIDASKGDRKLVKDFTKVQQRRVGGTYIVFTDVNSPSHGFIHIWHLLLSRRISETKEEV